MKAFTIYPKEEIEMRLLLNKLQNYGKFNGDFQTFCRLYKEWHKNNFPGCEVSVASVNFRNDWFIEFINYIANVEI